MNKSQLVLHHNFVLAHALLTAMRALLLDSIHVPLFADQSRDQILLFSDRSSDLLLLYGRLTITELQLPCLKHGTNEVCKVSMVSVYGTFCFSRLGYDQVSDQANNQEM